MSKIAIVGGTFDNDGGKSSSIVFDIANGIREYTEHSVDLHNGGYYCNLSNIIKNIENCDIIFWIVNIPNDLPKIENIKIKYPHKIVVTSKRNFSEYSIQEVIAHALNLKSNLVIEFSKIYDKNGKSIFCGSVLDPLGNIWYSSNDFKAVGFKTANRASYLSTITRVQSEKIGDSSEIPDESKFIEIIREYGKLFHDLIIPAKGVTRFLGNGSFRCTKGFPSFRDDRVMYISKRNVNKETICLNDFVKVSLDNVDKMCYYGENKPSVDAPIQARLYNLYPDVNYMIHSHVYIQGAEFTKCSIPCGAVEEVDEIVKIFPEIGHSGDYSPWSMRVNLLGHGSIVMSNTIDWLKDIKYYSRPIPEFGQQKYEG